MLGAGQFDREIKFISPRIVTDDSAGAKTIWTVERCAFANVRPGNSSEIFTVDQVSQVAQLVFTVRYFDTIGSDWQVIYKGKQYRIMVPQETVRNEELQIMARAVTNE